MGRPSKATEARIETLLVALRAGNTREAAAAHAEIDRTTLYRWLVGNPGLRVRVEKAEADAEVRFAAQVAHAASDDWKAARWWLETRRPRSYGRAQAAVTAAETPPPATAPHQLDDLAPGDVAARAAAWATTLAAEAAGVAARGGTGADAR
jgi:hypothetical protein